MDFFFVFDCNLRRSKQVVCPAKKIYEKREREKIQHNQEKIQKKAIKAILTLATNTLLCKGP